MMRILILLALVAGFSSCSRISDGVDSVGSVFGSNRGPIEIDGVRYRARISIDKTDRREMTITVSPASPNTAAALEAGRYEATKHCLRTFGGSDTEWSVGPDQPVEEVQIVQDTVTLRGRCTQR